MHHRILNHRQLHAHQDLRRSDHLHKHVCDGYLRKASAATDHEAGGEIAAGRRAKLKVKLTKGARKTLKKSRKLRTNVTIVITSRGEKKVTTHFKLTIKAPR
jgi:hypothetical protein